MLLGLAMTPFAVIAPLAPEKISAVILLAVAIFFLSAPQGLAPTIIQLVAPNRMRAQITALFMLVAVLVDSALDHTLWHFLLIPFSMTNPQFGIRSPLSAVY